MPHTIVVVPCYNEYERLDVRRFQDFARQSESIDFLLVNDGSRDQTLELLEQLHESDPRRFSFLHLAKNSGKAEAVRQGLLLALEKRPDYVGFWDADLATPLDDIVSFGRVLDRTPQIELVVGTRIRLLGHEIQRRKLRQYLGRLFANMAGLMLGTRIYDTQCGAKLFRVTPELPRLFAEPFVARWIFDVEILARLIQNRRAADRPAIGEIIYEFPLDHWRDVAGSKVKPADFATAIGEMFRIYWTYLRPGTVAPPAGAAGRLKPDQPAAPADAEQKRAA